MNTIAYFKERFEQLQPVDDQQGLDRLRDQAFQAFSQMGIPGNKHEEWKYTRISGLFNRDFQMPSFPVTGSVSASDLADFLLPGHEEANVMIFVNGFY